jgi:concanavalin A-like lectin/glucanase superfamily protein
MQGEKSGFSKLIDVRWIAMENATFAKPANNKSSSSSSLSPLNHYQPYLTLSGSRYTDTASNSSLQLTKFSVASWFQTSKMNTDDAPIVNKGGFGSESPGENMNYGIWMTNKQKIEAGFETSNGTDTYLNSPGPYNDSQWHYAVITYDGSILNL